VNLKTLLRKDQQAKTGKNYVGVLSRDVLCEEFLYDEHFTFIEMPPKPPVKHNPKVFDGKRISITRRDDGTLRPNFKPMNVGKGFSLARYIWEVCVELCNGLTGLIEER
jgi:hypothetical protein